MHFRPTGDGSAWRGSGAGGMTPSGISDQDERLSNEVLALFQSKPQRSVGIRFLADSRTPLDAEFIVGLYRYGYRRTMIGVEMKLGPKRLYVVPKIKELLDKIDRGESFPFTKHFIYDPELHRFRPEDEAVVRQLVRIVRDESLYLETAYPHPGQSRIARSDRMLLVPPFHAESFWPLLAAAPGAKLELDGRPTGDFRLSDEPLPLRFEFDEAEGEGESGYRLNVQGLDDVTVLESYGLAVADGKLVKMRSEDCRRLAELKHMLDVSGRDHIRIPAGRMEPFIEKVVPGLTRLGGVRIADRVAGRILQSPLKARLYLDRVKDRLLAGLEFQYGDVVIDPLADDERKRNPGRIVMRDGEKERRILELMEQTPCVRTEGGYIYGDEEEEYEFLYHTVPELEKLLTVYATSAVKARVLPAPVAPKASVHVDERTEWLEIRFDIGGIPEADVREVIRTLEEKRKFYRMPDGALLPLESEPFQEMIRFLNGLGVRAGDIDGHAVQLPAVRGLRLLDAPPPGDAIQLGKSLRRLLEHIRNPDHLDFPVPDSLAGVLRDYQKYGFGWMKTLAHYRFGGILADDMGLGKTLQSIAYLVSVLPDIRTRNTPALVVAPASLVYNWLNEIKTFAPHMRAVIADGTRDEREAAMQDAAGADVLITSYPLQRRDVGLYAGQPFHTLILDEAQAFKNYATQTAQAVKQIRADFRFALTGTPIENSLEELWSIFDAVFPGLFPDRKAFGDMPREAIASRIRPFLLRRLKIDVLKELPDKIETVQTSELLPEQKKLYMAYLAKLRHETLKHLDDETFPRNRIKILAGLTRLRQLCCHPALFVEGYAGSSGKFEQLMELIDECRDAGKRLLLFSQFTEMLGLVKRELGFRGVPFFYLDGHTPAAERVELCERFNGGERELFLISLKAGGTGLNLTGADTVVLYDLWWNPAVEQQAADRAYRIGQKKVVQVIRLVAQGTVEQKMYELQQRKKSLIDEVIDAERDPLSSLTEQDIRELLTV
ncbi:DEAD/DEAH box helicase [Paenibacillus sp. GYB003]|uniref:DEAD/DEAH box helicase n=1 Tax=Paenibacillus sp. GYB003 TaxID=2994392 RepID=UPI002F968A46